jgi:signal transduction histidine kinase
LSETTDRLTGLVNQILEIARLDSDRLRLERRPVALQAIVAEAMAELNGTAPMKVGLDVPAGLPALDVDPDRLRQVVVNLVGNAHKYGGPVTGIGLRARVERPGWVTVTVADDGPGIPADERSLVFERFFRGRSVGQSTIRGSGLGLYLCRRIAEAHGGQIWLDDVPAGTSVSFSVPLAAEGAIGD